MRCWESPCLLRHVVLFSGSLMTLYSLSPHLVVRKRKQGTWHQSRDPSWGMVGPNDHDMIPSQVPPPNTITLGPWISGYEFGGKLAFSPQCSQLRSVTCIQLHRWFCPVMWHSHDSNARKWKSAYFTSCFLQWKISCSCYPIHTIIIRKMCDHVSYVYDKHVPVCMWVWCTCVFASALRCWMIYHLCADTSTHLSGSNPWLKSWQWLHHEPAWHVDLFAGKIKRLIVCFLNYYIWFTMFCQFLLYSKVTQSNTYIYILFLMLSSIMFHHKWVNIFPCVI